jgi:hypothetical protein
VRERVLLTFFLVYGTPKNARTHTHTPDRLKEYLETHPWVVEAIMAGKEPIFVVSGVNWGWSSNDKCMQLQTIFVQDTKFVPPLRIDVIGTMDLLTTDYYNAVKADILARHDSAAYAISTEHNSQREENEEQDGDREGHAVPKRRCIDGGRIVSGAASRPAATSSTSAAAPADEATRKVSATSTGKPNRKTGAASTPDDESDDDAFINSSFFSDSDSSDDREWEAPVTDKKRKAKST